MSEGNPNRSPDAHGRRGVLRLAAYLASPQIEAAIDRVEEIVDSADTTIRSISENIELATQLAAPVSRKEFIFSLLRLTGSEIPTITSQSSVLDEMNQALEEEAAFDEGIQIPIAHEAEIQLAAQIPPPIDVDNDWYQEKPTFDL